MTYCAYAVECTHNFVTIASMEILVSAPPAKTTSSNESSDFGEWRATVDSEGCWLKKVAIQLDSESGLHPLYDIDSGRHISFAGFEVAIDVESE